MDNKVKASVRYYGEAFEMLSQDNAFEVNDYSTLNMGIYDFGVPPVLQ